MGLDAFLERSIDAFLEMLSPQFRDSTIWNHRIWHYCKYISSSSAVCDSVLATHLTILYYIADNETPLQESFPRPFPSPVFLCETNRALGQRCCGGRWHRYYFPRPTGLSKILLEIQPKTKQGMLVRRMMNRSMNVILCLVWLHAHTSITMVP